MGGQGGIPSSGGGGGGGGEGRNDCFSPSHLFFTIKSQMGEGAVGCMTPMPPPLNYATGVDISARYTDVIYNLTR